MNDYEHVVTLRNDRGSKFKVYWSPTFKRIWVEGTDTGLKAQWRENVIEAIEDWWEWNQNKRPYNL